MFQGFLFVILAAFVAFGITLFMATSAMDDRARSADFVPEATAAGNLEPESPVAATSSKGGKKGAGASRRPAGNGGSARKPARPSTNTPVETSLPKTPPVEPRRLF